MTRLLILIGIILIGSLFPQALKAQPLGQDGQLKGEDGALFSQVEMDCLDVKLRLTRVYEQDGLSRVNAGQVYDTISHKLMARLNAKVVDDRLDGGDLVKSTAVFEEALVAFRAEYREYEVALNSLLKSDCQSRQQAFYLALTEVRERRKKVHESVAALRQASKEYYDAFKEFRMAFLNQHKKKDEVDGQ